MSRQFILFSRLLQSEFALCHRIDPAPQKFLSVAKIYTQQFGYLDHSVFIDCNCLVLKNTDALFRKNGIQWVQDKEGSEYAVLLINSPCTKKENQKKIMQIIAARENGIKSEIVDMPKLEKINFCMQVDLNW